MRIALCRWTHFFLALGRWESIVRWSCRLPDETIQRIESIHEPHAQEDRRGLERRPEDRLKARVIGSDLIRSETRIASRETGLDELALRKEEGKCYRVEGAVPG